MGISNFNPVVGGRQTLAHLRDGFCVAVMMRNRPAPLSPPRLPPRELVPLLEVVPVVRAVRVLRLRRAPAKLVGVAVLAGLEVDMMMTATLLLYFNQWLELFIQ